MFFSSKLSVTDLLAWCRALKHGLDAGLSPVRILKQQAKSGPARARSLATDLADRMADGESMTEAIQPNRERLPVLFREMVAIGEETGRLQEAMETLEAYFEAVLSTRRDFLRSLMWPGFMFCSAVGTITLTIIVMGMLPMGGFDIMGVGTGFGGAIKFLFLVGSTVGIVVFLMRQLQNDERARATLEGMVVGVPGLGGPFRAFALQRFTMALHMTAEAGLVADRSLKLSLRATANSAYARNAERAAKLARGGEEMAEILRGCGPQLFPADFLDAVEVGETSGTLPEVMNKLSKQYQEQAVRGLKFLATLAGGLVYAGVALMVMFMIYRIVMSIMQPYQDALNMLDGLN